MIKNHLIFKNISYTLFFININNLLYKIYNDNVISSKKIKI